MKSGSVRIY